MTLADLPPRLQTEAARQMGGKPGLASVKGSLMVANASDALKVKRKARKARGPNKTELAFAASFFDADTRVDVRFEAITFRLPGGSRYTPDWVYFGKSGTIYCYEVKGRYKLGSHGRALTAFREARAAFPMITFEWFAMNTEGEFEEKYPAADAGRTAR